jgi:arylsulfatase A-like enzyme
MNFPTWFLPALGAVVLVPIRAGATPNVVVFLADDAGWGDYGHNGNEASRTPHIDSLARDGARLEHFYVCPVCAPTRAEFLTGRYHPRGGVRGVSEGQERLDVGERTIADAFRAAGYATGAFGKWHNGSQWPYHPRARGFDEYFGHTSGHWGEYFDAPLEHDGKIVRTRGYIVDACTDRALDFIGRHRDGPFFCYVPFTTPHSPWAAPAENWARFRDLDIRQRGAAGAGETVDETRCVLAMLENQDHNVGRVLAKLKESGLEENTIVVYFSDNGPNSVRWNGGMKGRKGSTDEGGIRSTGLVRWPGRIPAGTTVREVAGAIDLLPTLVSLAGIPRAGDRPLDGRDLSPLLRGGAGTDWPDRMLFSHWNGQVSARDRRFRRDAAGALFDLVADPGQTRDVSAAVPEEAARFRDAVEGWRREMGILPPQPGAAKGKGKGGLPPDDRPYPVGYREFPWTPLPARDGKAHGGVRRSSNAPNCSYFTAWTSPEDAITWDIAVATAGTYEAELHYTCPEADAGSRIELSFGESRVTATVAPGWDPPPYTNQDTLPRPPAETTMKEFRPLALGRLRLETGRGLLTLRALDVPGSTVADVRLLTLTLLPEP